MAISSNVSGHTKWLVYITLQAIYSVRNNEMIMDMHSLLFIFRYLRDRLAVGTGVN
jgi:hypothetical protein